MRDNACRVTGNLTDDPKMRQTQSGQAVANFTLAQNWKDAQGSDHTEWVPVTAWGYLAETAAQKLRKGMRVSVEGRYTSNSYTDKNGVKRRGDHITAESLFVQLFKDKEEKGDFSKFAAQPAPFPEGYEQEDIPF